MKKTHKKPLHKQLHRHAKLLVVPHKHNKYQPHLIRRGGIVAVLLLVVALQAAYITQYTGFVLGNKADMSSGDLLALTNAERSQAGAEPLRLNAELSVAATRKANDMIASDYWSHDSPNGTTPWYWIESTDYSYSYAGENLAKNFSTAQGVVNAWMHSDEHRDNIVKPEYKEVGFAVVEGDLKGEATTLVVAMYGTPKTSATLVSTQPTVLAATTPNESIMTQFGMVLQRLSPSALGSMILLLGAASVAATAHLYRKKLPKPVQQTWLKHHGLYKAVGMAGVAVVVVALYSGGQI